MTRVERTCVMCSCAVSSLANVRSCRVSLVNGGVLRLLAYWLNQAAYFLRTEPEYQSLVSFLLSAFDLFF